MEFLEIGNIVDIQKGRKHTFSENPDINSTRVLQIDDLRNDYNLKYTNDKKGVSASKNDILIAWDGANAGTIGFGKSGFIGSTIAVLKIKASYNLNHAYVGHFLKSKSNYLRSQATGATIPHIDKNTLESLKLPIISVQSQFRIAYTLNKIETLISCRKEADLILDNLLNNIFISMFGDPTKNERSWDYEPLGNYITDIITGSSFGGEEKEELDDNELGVLKVSAVTSGIFNPKEFKAVRKNLIDKKIINLLKGDLLFSRANTRELVGATCIVDADYYQLFLPDKIWKIKLDESKLNKSFIHALLQNKNFRTTLSNQATGSSSSMLNISMSKLRELECPIPPITLQEEFAEIIDRANILKSEYNKSLIELQRLYSSISQQAFTGNLDLSKVPVDEIDLKQYQQSISGEELPPPIVEEIIAPATIPKNKIQPPKKKDEVLIEKITWDNVSTETIANWIKEKYRGYHFNAEMLNRFLLEEHITILNYFSSEELKKNPPLNSKDDLKKFLYSALNGETPFLTLRQHFYNASSDSSFIKLTMEDMQLMEVRSNDEKSGIYFTIEEP